MGPPTPRVGLKFDGVDKFVKRFEAATISGDYGSALNMYSIMAPVLKLVTDRQIDLIVRILARVLYKIGLMPGALQYLQWGSRVVRGKYEGGIVKYGATMLIIYGQLEDALFVTRVLEDSSRAKQDIFHTVCNKYISLDDDINAANVALELFEMCNEHERIKLGYFTMVRLIIASKFEDALRCDKILLHSLDTGHHPELEERRAGILTVKGRLFYCTGNYIAAKRIFDDIIDTCGVSALEEIQTTLTCMEEIIENPRKNKPKLNHNHRICASCEAYSNDRDWGHMHCKGCTINWYCNDQCRKDDYDRHREYCNRWSRGYHYCMQCDPLGPVWSPDIKFCRHPGCIITLCKQCECPNHS